MAVKPDTLYHDMSTPLLEPHNLNGSGTTPDKIGSLLCNSNHCEDGVSRNDVWEDRRIDDSQTFDTMNPQLEVDDARVGIGSHPCGGSLTP